MADLIDWVKDVATDLRYDADARRMAAKLLEKWRAGIIPAPREVAALRKLLPRRSVCARLQRDGACAWLRKNFASQGLRAPRPGEKVVCRRQEKGPVALQFTSCEGFRPAKEDN